MPATLFSSKVTISVGSRKTPLKDSMQPITSQSGSKEALFTIALITAFNPGQSPPPVAIINLFILLIIIWYYTLYGIH